MILPIALLIIAVLFFIYLFLWKTKPTTHFYHKTSPLYIAHRGLHKTVPENTISAVERALKSGFTSVELDVISDSNNEIVCSHNIDLERETHGSGFVDEKEYSKLKHIVYRSAQTSKKNKNIPLLKTVLKRFKNETSFVLDVKTIRPMDLVLAKKIAALLKQLRLKESVIVSSFNPVFLLILKLINSKILTGFIYKNPKHLKLINIIQPDFLHPRGDLIDKGLIHYAKRKNIQINTWTINNPLSWKWLSSLGVNGIISDESPPQTDKV